MLRLATAIIYKRIDTTKVIKDMLSELLPTSQMRLDLAVGFVFDFVLIPIIIKSAYVY